MLKTGAFPSNVLLVEDSALVALTVTAMLEDLGIKNITLAKSVSEALAAIAAQDFNLALLDLQLGEENGLVVADHCAAKDIPIIFSTGYGDLILPVTFSSEQLLIKPYTMADLERALLLVKK